MHSLPHYYTPIPDAGSLKLHVLEKEKADENQTQLFSFSAATDFVLMLLLFLL